MRHRSCYFLIQSTRALKYVKTYKCINYFLVLFRQFTALWNMTTYCFMNKFFSLVIQTNKTSILN